MSYTLEDLVREREWRKIAPDWERSTVEELAEAFDYFCRTHWHIRHPSRGKIKFEMFDAQRETINLWLEERYSICLKARQIGFSTLVSTFCFWLTFFYPDRAIVMLSKTERDAVKLLAKAKYGVRFLPLWIKERGPVMSINQTRMGFSNESYIESLPSASDPARGESVYTVVVDEMGQLPNSEEAWASIEPIADVGGRVIMLGTANGEGNLFHTLWMGSQTGSNRFKGLFFPWHVNGRDDDWYEAKKRDLPDWQLAQEYPSDPDEAFLRSGRPAFNVEALKSIKPEDPLVEGYLQFDKDGRVELVEQPGGPLKVWEAPEKGTRYVIGADVAEGLDYGDYSCAYVIDAKTRHVVACFHARIDADLFGSDVLNKLGRLYNRALVGVESNNHGLSTNKGLEREGYSPIYRQRPLNRLGKASPSVILGWRTTQVSKPLAIDELNMAIREGELEVRDEKAVVEMRSYVREGDGKMHGSPHDDRVMALSIAVQMLKFVWLREFTPETKPPAGTFGWWDAQLFGALDHQQASSGRPMLGQHNVRTA